MGASLKQKAVKGVTWSLAEKFGVNGLRLVLGIILARLLTPEDFGLIGMITVFFLVAQVFIDSGFGQAYIQKKDVTDVDANTVFFINLGVSIILYGILWFSAPLIARFYEQPQLVELTRVMALVVVLNAFNLIQIAQLTRDVNFKRKTLITLISITLAGSGGITAAYYGLGVWALVIQQLSNRFLTTVGLWLTSKWKPVFQFSKQSFKEMFSFGFWVLVTSIIRTVFDNIYILTIGKLFPVAQLGFYTKAKQFQQTASQNLSQAVGAVAFPVFSKYQHDKERLRNNMQKFLTHSMAFIAPIMITLIVVAEPFVILLLKEKWAPMIPYLQLLCILGLLYPIHALNVQVLMAQGKSKLHFKLAMIKNGLRILNIIAMYRFGVIYIIIGEVTLSFVALAINTFFTKRLVDYGLFQQLKSISKIIAGALIAGLITYGFSLTFKNYWIILFIGTALSAGLYIAWHYIYNRAFFFEIIQLKDNFIKKK